MRLLRGLQEVGVLELQTAQRSSLSRAHQFVNEWELKGMVVASFSLQLFLLFFSGFRKRYSSRVLSVLLWLAYLSADSLAVYILGRLTLRGGSGNNHLALFWAPFLLLHLGGQETMTAFSMEDNALWKRHLLSLVTQVPMATYVVSKQLRVDNDADQWLVAPMVLVFVAGTGKYAERIWALRRAGSVAPGTSRSTSKLVSRASNDAVWDTQGFYGQLRFVISKKQERNFEVILDVAAQAFKLSLHFLMDMTPSISLLPEDAKDIKQAVEVLQSSEDRVHMAYKLAEINLSLIYDYLYTKFGTRHFHMLPFCNVFHRIVALVLPSVALGLFVRGMTTGGRKGHVHDTDDVIICYMLLVGAVVLETCSIFMSFISSCWAYKTIISCSLTCPLCRDIPGAIAGLLWVARRLHPGNKGEWSAKMAQYNMIRGCIKEKQDTGLLRRAMRWVGIIGEPRAITHTSVSPELKKLILDKLLDIAATPRVQEWDIGVGKFRGQWAQWVVETKQDRANHDQVLQICNIQGLEFVSSVLLWHVVTDICLLATDDVAVDGDDEERLEDGGSSHHEDVQGSLSELRGPIRELSDYVMYLVADCGAMAGSEGHYVVTKGQKEVSRWLLEKHGGGSDDRKKVIEEIRDEDSSFFHENYYPVLDRARRVASDLLQVGEAGDRWELISAVWLEMLCYVAYNCGAAFHAKHLATGGEFVTHIKMLLFMVGVPFLRDVKESLFPEAGNIYS
ncbi:hypothetical protein CFC21_091092 [Triticum aestivum]|uniref:DUF4220 domain-containing protein n=5 Tax=Triticinae TaxID=1648030 RepID=A0A453MUB1_AEGTS|nr:uncharacterized protein LOC109745218 [Aegilops tauschii subsp. strangulata]XP_044417909.1 uncharacterized protein LOC123143139 [Triticum aestivum]KAF7087934.1 hypothetical protein CFC21_091092 [Triticum aestivum]